MNPTVLVTGGTGRIGGSVLRQLDRAGVQTRALVRDPARASALPTSDVVVGDLSDPAALSETLDRVDAAFLVFPTLQAEQTAPELVRLLADRCERLVYLSSNGAGSADPTPTDIVGSHARIEHLIADTGVSSTFLRPGGFAANTLGWAGQIRAGDTVRWFHGQARRSLIHEDDIAEVAVRALTETGHDGEAFHLTGPETLTQEEQLAAVATVLERPLRFVELTPTQAREELFADAPPELATAILDGHADMVTHPEPVTTTVERLLGRPAVSYAQWARDHAADFGAS